MTTPEKSKHNTRTLPPLVPEGYKWCWGCETPKPLKDFWHDATRRDGYVSRCKPCRRKQTNRWAEANPESYLEGARRSRRRNRIEHKYNLSAGEYDRLRDACGGLCYVCGSAPVRRLQIDCCDGCGGVLGFLCEQCKYKRRSLTVTQARVILSSVTSPSIRVLAAHVADHTCSPASEGDH